MSIIFYNEDKPLVCSIIFTKISTEKLIHLWSLIGPNIGYTKFLGMGSGLGGTSVISSNELFSCDVALLCLPPCIHDLREGISGCFFHWGSRETLKPYPPFNIHTPAKFIYFDLYMQVFYVPLTCDTLGLAHV